jgi:hypothetical protein
VPPASEQACDVITEQLDAPVAEFVWQQAPVGSGRGQVVLVHATPSPL